MKAILFEQYRNPAEVLSLRELPLPEPGTGEVRIRILASPINPSDLLFARGLFAGVQPTFPSSAGFEGVGLIDALGPQVQGFSLGQRVAVINAEKGGNWADYAVQPTSVLVPVPGDIPDEQVASFLINPATAIAMVRRVLAVPRGEWLLQSAAGSDLGRMIIRLAQLDGIKTINIVRRRESVAELKQLGADAVIVSTEGPIDEQVRTIVGNGGVKYAIDPVVGETGTQMYQTLSEDGRILEVFWLGYWIQSLNYEQRRELFTQIITLMRDGVLLTSSTIKFPLEAIGDAVRTTESTARQGKVLLTPAQR